ncbi:MAG: hypothetical protein US04_C0001G0132 [Candidatus Nomurabacteria bacterium GW2011_GWD2_36_14]|nr:MAG: hypothetical protein UR97_C0004G0111 [Candidatus Nomurabacteria bacterium GW2011_GWE2_36_115]KKP94242.1 MAG: hypothetical protein US00_C0003G0166 [Candidatus Nomurabacteria bacterium GW2011_GWF2_36_126]KKP96630.1 MAG: hypothetical protein US04_C0001G0132 [Candidatus Nomurabacteria bacterium GW2011_GWD2_36_14]KKP99766.1 MAG: hypothetical protein US08_C0001G0449 [Candidatus Nomurabacteria bacterium GW2011_GWF2_36_19]KKQ05288.1 MAG: hypothetical protein US17_C0005G0055 [Candidatus Nomuraba
MPKSKHGWGKSSKFRKQNSSPNKTKKVLNIGQYEQLGLLAGENTSVNIDIFNISH